MDDELFSLQQEMDAEGVILSFRGAVTQEVIISLGDALKKQVEIKSNNMSTNMKVFSAFIELVQNIDRYSGDRRQSPPQGDVSYGIFVIGFKDDNYFLRCGNIIEQAHRQELEELLCKLEAMDRQELKAFYKEQRRKPAGEQSLGAGLGFIELARNSKSMEHFFTPTDQGQVFFSVHVTI